MAAASFFVCLNFHGFANAGQQKRYSVQQEKAAKNYYFCTQIKFKKKWQRTEPLQ
jgi:hypothetical protein